MHNCKKVSVLKVLTPFLPLDIFDRYFPQMKAIAEQCNEFHVVYSEGQPDPEWAECITFHMVKFPSWCPWYAKRLFGTDIVWKKIRHIEVDVYYSLSGIWSQHYTSHFALVSRKPYVLRLRGDYRADRYYQHPIKRMLFDRVFRRSLHGLTLVIPIADKMKPVAMFYGTPKERVTESIPNGIDVSMFKPIQNCHSFTVGYIGRLSPEKGCYFLRHLMEATPDVNYLVAGQKSVKWKPPSNCNYLGRMEYEMTPNFYSLCDLVILPSYTEGFPNVLLEAYACGKPVIGSPEAFPSKLVIYGWRLPLVINKWVEKIKWFRFNQHVLKQIGEKAQNFAMNYSWNRFGEKMIKFFEQAIELER